MALTDKQPYRYQQTGDRQVNQLQSDMRNLSLSVTSQPWANGTETDDTVFTVGQTLVLNHGLGRAPLGFFVIDCSGGYGAFYRTAQTGTLDNNTIQLRSQNACTARFWVY